MIYQILSACIISGLIGFKKPIFGALAGIVATLVNYFTFYEFDQLLFYVLFVLGGFAGFVCAWIIHWIFYGVTDDRNSSKPRYKAFPGGSGGSWGGGVIYIHRRRTEKCPGKLKGYRVRLVNNKINRMERS